MVLFDLDGTLIDTVELIYQSFKYATEKVLGRNFSRDELLQNLGRPLLDQMHRFSPAKAEELIEVYHQHNLARHDEMIRSYPGTSETLAILRERGFRLGVVTSKRRDLAKRGLIICGLYKFIEMMVAMEDTELHKPDPEPVKLILSLFQTRAENSIFVGDSPFDLTSAHGAGAHAVAALWGPFKKEVLEKENPEAKIKKITDLPQLLA